MKRVLFILLFIIMFFNVNVVNADDICSDEELAREKEIANNISYNYEFIGNKDVMVSYQTYNVSFTGITDDVYITDDSNSFYAQSDSDVIQIQSGKRNIGIISKNCSIGRLRTMQIDLPKFNEYSEEKVCSKEEYKKLDYCNPWYQGDIDDDVFEKTISNRKLEIDNSNKSFFTKVYDYFSSHLYYTVGGIIVIIIVLVIIVVRNNRKNILE